ncbi:MAG: SCO1664 family protein [Micrococcales bacterium]|nr:SCO1664 family protein [Micrococcales bacterium]
MDTAADSERLELLEHGSIELIGRLAEASNTALLVTVSGNGRSTRAVYKPVRGEQPLWDYPDGTLAGRERAAYLVSQMGGWDCVPPTVLREGPLGPGSLQWWVDWDTAEDWAVVDVVAPADVPDGWLPVLDGRDELGRPVLVVHQAGTDVADVALFDAVINNSDRKGSHLARVDGHLWGFDHGVSLSVEPKLRTVLWGWAGTRLAPAQLERVAQVGSALTGSRSTGLESLLTVAEIEALAARCVTLGDAGRFPAPSLDWPAVPWPPL